MDHKRIDLKRTNRFEDEIELIIEAKVRIDEINRLKQ